MALLIVTDLYSWQKYLSVNLLCLNLMPRTKGESYNTNELLTTSHEFLIIS